MTKLKCPQCVETFTGAQGLASHMRWHERGASDNRRANQLQSRIAKGHVSQNASTVTANPTGRPPGVFQEKLLNVLEGHPQGISCQNIARQLQAEGYKNDLRENQVAQRVSSTASNLKSKVTRMSRGIYKLKSSASPGKHPIARTTETSTSTTMVPQQAPELPKEALLLQIEHLTESRGRLRNALLALMPGDLR